MSNLVALSSFFTAPAAMPDSLGVAPFPSSDIALGSVTASDLVVLDAAAQAEGLEKIILDESAWMRVKARLGNANLFASRSPLTPPVPDILLFPPPLATSAQVYAGQPMGIPSGQKKPFVIHCKTADQKESDTSPYAPMAQEIRGLLEERGWSRRELWRRARMPEGSCGMILSGRWLARKWWGNLAEALGLTPDYFAVFAKRHELLSGRSPSSYPRPFREVGAAIARRRKERGLTQMELGRQSGIGNTYISHLEAGRVSGLRCLRMIEEILGVERGRYSKQVDRILSAGPSFQRRLEILRRRQGRRYGRLGALVEEMRISRDWSRTDLGRRVGCPRSVIGDLEMGVSPHFDIWPSLERAFNKKPGFFRRRVRRWGLPSTRVESEGQRRQPARWGRWRRLAQE
ncbi:MAG: helix-turn-helix domain-containing protein, partial [Deltaproteobacteria bacterium]|nr:helix-turn-helix domain-containing protein [Deltaproteobacteria bacterium]